MTALQENAVNSIATSRSDGTHQARMMGGITASRALGLILFFDASILLVAGGHLLIGAPSWTISLLFSLDNEPTIPGWYASMKLLLVACLLAALSVSVGTGSSQRCALLGAAFLFLLMSCDEAAAIHERLQRAINNRLLTGVTDHIYEGEVLTKVIVGLTALAIAAFAVVVVVQTLRGIGRGKIAFGIGFLLLAIGAVGVDLTEEFLPIAPTGMALLVILEEAFEMTGVTLMIYGVLQALACAPVTLYLGAQLSARRGGV
jgi:hypothetical protein